MVRVALTGAEQFLKDTPRDPASKARLNNGPMAPVPRSSGRTRAENRRIEDPNGKGKGIARYVPREDVAKSIPTNYEATKEYSRWSAK